MSSLLWAVREVRLWGNTATLTFFCLLYYDEYVMILTCFNLWLSLVCKTYKPSKGNNLLVTFVYEVFPRKWGLRKKKRLWLRQGLPRLKWIFKRRIFKPQLILFSTKKKIYMSLWFFKETEFDFSIIESLVNRVVTVGIRAVCLSPTSGSLRQ